MAATTLGWEMDAWNMGQVGSMPTAPAAASTGATGTQIMSAFGVASSIAGIFNSAIGSFYAAKNSKIQLESQRDALRFQQKMSEINARQAENQAQDIMRAGEHAMGQVSMRAGQTKSSAKAMMAARGIDLGVGNAAEVVATTDLMKEIDMLTINSNRVRAAGAARMQGVNYGNQALLQGVSANNMGLSAGTISPFMAAGTSLLGGASIVAKSLFQDRQLAKIAARLGIDD